MNATMKMVCFTILSTCLISPPTNAADNCTGYDVLVSKSYEKMELGQGYVLSYFSAYSVVTSDNWPMANGTTGECSGSELATSDGGSKSRGYCLRKDKDGDIVSIAWEWPSNAGGTWTQTGGTGKFAHATGSGWAKPFVGDGKMEMVKWGGNCAK